MKYRLVEQWQQKAIPVKQACAVLGVSRAGYYQHRQRTPKAADAKDTVRLHAMFVASGCTYGSRRLQHALRADGVHVGIVNPILLMSSTVCYCSNQERLSVYNISQQCHGETFQRSQKHTFIPTNGATSQEQCWSF